MRASGSGAATSARPCSSFTDAPSESLVPETIPPLRVTSPRALRSTLGFLRSSCRGQPIPHARLRARMDPVPDTPSYFRAVDEGFVQSISTFDREYVDA